MSEDFIRIHCRFFPIAFSLYHNRSIFGFGCVGLPRFVLGYKVLAQVSLVYRLICVTDIECWYHKKKTYVVVLHQVWNFIFQRASPIFIVEKGSFIGKSWGKLLKWSQGLDNWQQKPWPPCHSRPFVYNKSCVIMSPNLL